MAASSLRAPLEKLSDDALIERSRTGDTAAFGELWRRHEPAGRTVARSYTSTFDPDDVVAEAFAKILQAIKKGGGPNGAFRPYLFTTIRNTAAGWGRARNEVPIDDAETIEDPTFNEENTLAALDRSLTTTAFRSLPTRWQEALWYSEVEQMTPQEIGPLLGMKANAVAALTYRAREGLRQAWIQAHLAASPADSDCRWTIERLGGYARNSLGKRETARVDDHLQDCAKCTIVAAEAKDVSSRLALVLLPLAAGMLGAAAYTVHLQSGASAAYALGANGVAMPASVLSGGAGAGHTAGAGAASAGAGSAGAGSAGAGSAGAGGAGSAGGTGAGSATGAAAGGTAGATGAAAASATGIVIGAVAAGVIVTAAIATVLIAGPTLFGGRNTTGNHAANPPVAAAPNDPVAPRGPRAPGVPRVSTPPSPPATAPILPPVDSPDAPPVIQAPVQVPAIAPAGENAAPATPNSPPATTPTDPASDPPTDPPTTPPTAPVISVPPTDAPPTTNPVIDFAGTGIPGNTVTVTSAPSASPMAFRLKSVPNVKPTQLFGSATVEEDPEHPGTGLWSLTIDLGDAPNGNYTFTAVQTNPDGSLSSDPVTRTVTLAKPVIPPAPTITSVDVGPVDNGAGRYFPVVSGTAKPSATVTLTDAAGDVIATVTAGADGSWTTGPLTAFGVGESSISAKQSDNDGNGSAESAPTSFSLAAPGITWSGSWPILTFTFTGVVDANFVGSVDGKQIIQERLHADGSSTTSWLGIFPWISHTVEAHYSGDGRDGPSTVDTFSLGFPLDAAEAPAG